jgi:uncharacterized delta-60 repeat protein
LASVPKRTRCPRLRPTTVASAVASLWLLSVPSLAAGQPGALDPSFGGDGKVTPNLTSGPDFAVGLVIQGDGKLVAAGLASGGGGRFALVRYAGANLDDTFGGDGQVFTNFTAGFDGANDLAIQTDGKLVAAGAAGGGGGRFALARYDTDGTLDTSFGGDGKVTTNFSPGDDFAFGVAIQTDGKIVVVGRAGGSGGRVAVARYDDDGTLDTSFSGDGKATTNITGGDDRVDQLAIQADGAIVVAGTAGYFGNNARFALVRFSANGTLDATFGGDGKVTTNVDAGFDGAFAVAIQPADQKIVAAGQARLKLAVLRYNPDGTLDSTFAGDGKATTNFTRGLDYADDVALASDGKIVAAGTANWFGRNARFALARYDGDGTLDTTFGGDGRVVTDFTSSFDGVFDVEIQPADGNIVAAGAAGRRGAKFALARYLGT